MSNHKLIEAVTKSQLRTDLPTFRSGDTLRVHVRIVEGSRERIQVFEGVVIKRRGKVRRAKLYYLRSLRGKAARIQEIR